MSFRDVIMRMSENNIDNIVEVTRLLLLAQLVEITGNLWEVTIKRDPWDIYYYCNPNFVPPHYGGHRHFPYDMELEKMSEHIENKMKKAALGIAKIYFRHMKMETE